VTPDAEPVAVTQVEYFNGTTSLGMALQAPYALTLENVAAGTYQIVAKVSTTDASNPLLQSAPLAVTVGSAPGAATAYFIHTDQLNTPRAITNAGGAMVWQWDSDPFGKDSANEQPAGQPAFTYNPRFPGQQFDRESNLHYNYFRDYDPALGRYVQSDPIGLRGGVNTFGYVQGNPISFVDPLGLIKIPGIPGAEGETSVHANPGPDATDFRPEHGPDHVHLGANDGPRVRTSDFHPFSKDDALKMSRKQKKFCEGLAEASKDKIRKAQEAIFKHGKIILQIQAGGTISIAAACRADPLWCADRIEEGTLP
jgi:RHS repeat-associated protein